MESDVACPICTMTDILTTAEGHHECATCGHEWAGDAGDPDALGEIRDDMVRKGIQPNAVQLRNPDFQMLARAYGCLAEKPADLEALASAIRAALAADRPTLIEVRP